jgi:hypothetical protein
MQDTKNWILISGLMLKVNICQRWSFGLSDEDLMDIGVIVVNHGACKGWVI